MEKLPLLAAFVGWCVLLVVPFLWLRSKDKSGRVGLWFLFGLPVVFLGHWMLGGTILPLLLWLFWIGDNDHWFWHTGHYWIAALAGFFTSVVAARVLLWRAGWRYAAVNCLAAVMGLLLLGWFYGARFARDIDGWSPEAARKQAVARHPNVSRIPLTWSRVKTEFNLPPEQCVTFLGGDHEGPYCRVTVCRHGLLWWKQRTLLVLPPRKRALAQLKEFVLTNPNDAPLLLQQFVNDYPGTSEAEEARQLLEQVGRGP